MSNILKKLEEHLNWLDTPEGKKSSRKYVEELLQKKQAKIDYFGSEEFLKSYQTIYNWVKEGGVLVLFHNDKPNADFTAINKLSDLFGIHFNEDTYNKVIGINYLGGKIDVPAGHQILKNVQTIYQKEVCSITVKAPAKSVLTKGDLVVFATAKIGKGTVFATGDPWLYNEYTDGRMLPTMYQNAEAAKDLVKWLISQIPVKK